MCRHSLKSGVLKESDIWKWIDEEISRSTKNNICECDSMVGSPPYLPLLCALLPPQLFTSLFFVNANSISQFQFLSLILFIYLLIYFSWSASNCHSSCPFSQLSCDIVLSRLSCSIVQSNYIYSSLLSLFKFIKNKIISIKFSFSNWI